MKVKQLLDRRAGYSLASLGLLLSLAAPAVVPAFASAAQLSARSITMSTSAVSATNVSYNLKFTGTAAIDGTTENGEGGIIIDFCSNSGVLGDSCTRPSGMVTSGVGVTGVKYGNVAAAANGSVASGAAGHIVWTAGDDYDGDGDTFEMTLTGITNPSSPGVFYARITTYADAGALASYVAVNGNVGTYGDEGSIALAATSGIGVTSYVLEAMSFCVSYGGSHGETQAAPSVNCGTGGTSDCTPPEVDDGCVVAPSMTLGETVATGVYALSASAVSTGLVYAQLSSNASGNTVVNLKSDATSCGGLYRDGIADSAHCGIAAKNSAGGIAAGQSLFGLKVGAATPAPASYSEGDPVAGTGSGTIAPAGSYSSTDYYIDAATDNSTGVTSPYGSALFQTTGAVDNMNVPITFGASISNTTPGGTYGATLNMIAVGTF